MKREKISEALNNISSRYIEEAIEFSAKKEARQPQNAWIKWASLAAACVALAILIVPVINHFNAPLQNVEGNTTPNGDVTGIIQNNTPETNTSPNDDANNKPGNSENEPGAPDNDYGHVGKPGENDPGENDPGQNDPGSLPPISVEYNSIEEAHSAIQYNTLYSNLVPDESGFDNITTIFPSSVGTEGNLLVKPNQLIIHSSYDNGDSIDMVDYYVLFGKTSVDESYIGGYVEQGLTKEIKGVTVHYCLFESNGRMNGQAKFLYDGNLYVIDVKTNGDTYNLDTYVEMVLK